MFKGKLENKHWIFRLIVWVSTAMVLTLIAMSVFMLFPDKTSITSLKWMQFLQTAALFLLPPLVVAYLTSTQPARWLSLSGSRLSWQTIAVAATLMVLALPGINLLSYLNQQMTLPDFLAPLEAFMKQQEEAAAALTEQFVKADNIGILLINIALMALLPAIAEELTFRGLLVSPFKTQTAIWCSAILFSAIHFQFYGFVPRMLLGALFGYALCWSGSIWAPMLMHFVNNCSAVLLYYIAYARGWDTEAMDAFGTGSTLWVGILSLLAIGPMVYLLHRICQKK